MTALAALSLLLLASSSEAPGAPAFTAMTYNVMFDSTEQGKSLAVIESKLPDVVCLQELTPSFAAAFVRRLATHYPHRAFSTASGTWGVGIASKHPLRNTGTFQQKPHRMPAMEARVTLGGQELVISCLHLFPPGAKRKKGETLFEAMGENAKLRKQQAQALVTRYKSERAPILLLGDLNEGAGDDAFSVLLGAGFTSACATSPCGPTFPGATSALPAVVQIDHVLGRGLTFTDARTLKAGGADHYPVIATFRPVAPAK